MPTTHADIVERLRAAASSELPSYDYQLLTDAAASEIERLRTVALENRYIDTSRYDDPANPLGPELMDTDSTTVDRSPSPLWPGKPHD